VVVRSQRPTYPPFDPRRECGAKLKWGPPAGRGRLATKVRTAGRLQFWLLGQRRTGPEPSKAEVTSKRAEWLIELGVAGAPDATAGAG
jgi:hypothetical protein